MSKILIIGASGFLGSKLYSMINAEHEVVGTYQAGEKEGLFQLDITDSSSVDNFLRTHNPDVVIHTAALSDPDECERNHD